MPQGKRSTSNPRSRGSNAKTTANGGAPPLGGLGFTAQEQRTHDRLLKRWQDGLEAHGDLMRLYESRGLNLFRMQGKQTTGTGGRTGQKRAATTIRSGTGGTQNQAMLGRSKAA